MSRARLIFILLCLATLLALPACVTPSVPIPPPEPEKMAFEVDLDTGTASFTYQRYATYADAVVYVFDRDTGQGVITTAEADGSVAPTEPFPAMSGDEVVITFELDAQLASTCVVLQQGQSNSGQRCDI